MPASLNVRYTMTDRSSGDLPRAALERQIQGLDGVVRAELRSRVGDGHHLDDLVQETMTQALTGLHRVRQPAAVPGWMRLIAKRRAYDHLRQRGRGKHLRPLPDDADPVDPNAPPADQVAAYLELSELVVSELARLPETVREPTRLRVLHSESIAAIARSLDRPTMTAHHQVQRGLELLRGRLEKAGVGAMLPFLELPGTGIAAGAGISGGRSWWHLRRFGVAAGLFLGMAGATFLWGGELFVESLGTATGALPTASDTVAVGQDSSRETAPAARNRDSVSAIGGERAIRGRVVRKDDGVPVAGALVFAFDFVSGEEYRATTDDGGAFLVSETVGYDRSYAVRIEPPAAQAGRGVARVSLGGCRTSRPLRVELPRAVDVELQFRLKASPESPVDVAYFISWNSGFDRGDWGHCPAFPAAPVDYQFDRHHQMAGACRDEIVRGVAAVSVRILVVPRDSYQFTKDVDLAQVMDTGAAVSIPIEIDTGTGRQIDWVDHITGDSVSPLRLAVCDVDDMHWLNHGVTRHVSMPPTREWNRSMDGTLGAIGELSFYLGVSRDGVLHSIERIVRPPGVAPVRIEVGRSVEVDFGTLLASVEGIPTGDLILTVSDSLSSLYFVSGGPAYGPFVGRVPTGQALEAKFFSADMRRCVYRAMVEFPHEGPAHRSVVDVVPMTVVVHRAGQPAVNTRVCHSCPDSTGNTMTVAADTNADGVSVLGVPRSMTRGVAVSSLIRDSARARIVENPTPVGDQPIDYDLNRGVRLRICEQGADEPLVAELAVEVVGQIRGRRQASIWIQDDAVEGGELVVPIGFDGLASLVVRVTRYDFGSSRLVYEDVRLECGSGPLERMTATLVLRPIAVPGVAMPADEDPFSGPVVVPLMSPGAGRRLDEARVRAFVRDEPGPEDRQLGDPRWRTLRSTGSWVVRDEALVFDLDPVSATQLVIIIDDEPPRLLELDVSDWARRSPIVVPPAAAGQHPGLHLPIR